MRSNGRIVGPVAIIAGPATGMALVQVSASETTAAGGRRWHAAAKVSGEFTFLTAVAAPSGRDGWALGATSKEPLGPQSPVAWHWDGHSLSSGAQGRVPAQLAQGRHRLRKGRTPSPSRSSRTGTATPGSATCLN